MRSVHEYISEAKKRNHLRSNNEVARAIGITHAAISIIANEKAIPNDETIVRLAELAGIDEREALLDVAQWRAAKNPKVKGFWEEIQKAMKVACMFTALYLVNLHLTPVKANDINQMMQVTCKGNLSPNLYYVYSGKLGGNPRFRLRFPVVFKACE